LGYRAEKADIKSEKNDPLKGDFARPSWGEMPHKRRYRKSWLSAEMRSEALLLFRVADNVKAKRKIVRRWNSFHAYLKVSLSSLYRWDRLVRMNMAGPIGSCEMKKDAALTCRRMNYPPSQNN